MRHVKQYEGVQSDNIWVDRRKQYFVGDYILAKKLYDGKPSVFYPAKIISINLYVTFPIKIMEDDEDIGTIQEFNVVRHLTTEEIEQFEAKIAAKKYNL